MDKKIMEISLSSVDRLWYSCSDKSFNIELKKICILSNEK